jgi:LEM3 (ligand-effect modulator 3) family / CDC50 family
VRSLDSKQQGGKNSTSSACEPIQYVGNKGKNSSLPNQGKVNPCGLIAWSNFNDTFAVSVGGRSQPIDVSCPARLQRCSTLSTSGATSC